MRRRWILRILLLLPILLCLAGWAASVNHILSLRYRHAGYFGNVSTEWGVLLFEWGQFNGGVEGWRGSIDSISPRVLYLPERGPQDFSLLGFHYYHRRYVILPYDLNFVGISIPYWFLLLVFGFAFFLAWRKTRPLGNPKAFPVEVVAPHDPRHPR